MIFSEGVIANEGHALQRPKGIQLFNLCIAQAARIVLLECLAHDWQATQFSIHILCENCSRLVLLAGSVWSRGYPPWSFRQR